jgi:hypothetical protein
MVTLPGAKDNGIKPEILVTWMAEIILISRPAHAVGAVGTFGESSLN